MVVESEPGNFRTCSGISCGNMVSVFAATFIFKQVSGTAQKFLASAFNITLFSCFWRDVNFHLVLWKAGVMEAGTFSSAELDSICCLSVKCCVNLLNIAPAFQRRASSQNFNTTEVKNKKQEVKKIVYSTESLA